MQLWITPVVALGLLVTTSAFAQQRRPTAPANPARPTAETQIGTRNYDVVLEVPELTVDSLGLQVAGLDARLSLSANAARLVSLTAGADVRIDRVDLELIGVAAEAYLYVDLDNVARIVNRVFATLDNNTELVTQLLNTVDSTVSAVGAVGQTPSSSTQPGMVPSQTVNALGQTVQRTVSATGDIVEQTLDSGGNVVSSRTVGNLSGLLVLRKATNAAGQTVRQVRDRDGGIIEYTTDAAGQILSSRVLPSGGRQRP